MKAAEILTFESVFKKLPYAILYFIAGSALGALISYLLFNLNRNLLEYIMSLWSKRMLGGVAIFGGQYAFWFILNNIVALMLIIVALLLINRFRTKTPTFLIGKRFGSLERHHPKITVAGLYIIPIGALMINGFLISLFVTYVLLNYGFSTFTRAVVLLLPHGLSEVLALFLASSLALRYLEILTPSIMGGDRSVETGKRLLGSRVTLFVMILIIILVLFGGFIEGALVMVLAK